MTLNKISLSMLEDLVVVKLDPRGPNLLATLSDGSQQQVDIKAMVGVGPQGAAGPQGATGATGATGAAGPAGPTYQLYQGSVQVDIAARSPNTQFYFDFTSWFDDFKARFGTGVAADFIVVPFPIASSTIIGNPDALIETSASATLGDYAYVKFVTSAPDYLNGTMYQFHLSLGARGLASDGTDHSYSTGVAMSYTIQFIGGIKDALIRPMSASYVQSA